MSYYRYITPLYKSFLPELNRTLRSSSVPRHVDTLDTGRHTRSISVPPSTRYSEYLSARHAATPFRDRATSVPSSSSTGGTSPQTKIGYGPLSSDFDLKVLDYMGRLNREDTVKSYICQTRATKAKQVPGQFSSGYNYYDGNKHGRDYLYPASREVLGTWKHYNLSNQTLNERNQRATSPLVARELNRYYGTQKRTDYLGDVSSGGATDFRYYNYRPVPYLGGSDQYKFMQCKPFRKNSNGNGNGGMCL